jgi:hypothetical protein
MAWDCIPVGGQQRSIRNMVVHMRGWKVTYEHYTLGDGTLHW